LSIRDSGALIAKKHECPEWVPFFSGTDGVMSMPKISRLPPKETITQLLDLIRNAKLLKDYKISM
jgi:hypothetical protein